MAHSIAVNRDWKYAYGIRARIASETDRTLHGRRGDDANPGVHMNVRLVRPATEPRVNVRPGALVRAAPCHDADVAPRDTEDFLVPAPYFGKYGL